MSQDTDTYLQMMLNILALKRLEICATQDFRIDGWKDRQINKGKSIKISQSACTSQSHTETQALPCS